VRGWPRPPHFTDRRFAWTACALYDAMHRGREKRFYSLTGMLIRRVLAAGINPRVVPPVHGARFGTGQRALRRLVAYAPALSVERNGRFLVAHGGIEAFATEPMPEPPAR
jgi:hypothetical protein